MSKPAVSESTALSVQTPSKGQLAAATSGAAAEIDLRAWVKDPAGNSGADMPRYVSLKAEGVDVYYLFAAATGASIVPATRQSVASAADVTIPDLLSAGERVHYLVDPAYPFLRFITGGGAGVIRVFRS